MPQRDARDDATPVLAAAPDDPSVASRMFGGVLLLMGRGLIVRGFSFCGSLVLARLLLPEDFGLIAIGGSITLIANLVAEAGLGARLIGRAGAPSRAELQALLAMQMAVCFLVVGAAATAAVTSGSKIATVVFLMLLGLPISSMQTPGHILLERDLHYGRKIVVEIGEVVAYQAAAVGLVLAGYGVLGFAAASMVRSAVGTALMAYASPMGLLLPRFEMKTIKPLLGFGFRFQAVGFVNMAGDLAFNTVVTATGGVATLGLWAVANRVLQLPFLLFETVWRVTYPGFARLMDGGEDLGPILMRGARMSALISGLAVVPLAGAGPSLFEVVFGPRWADAGHILIGAVLGMIIACPISMCSTGFLYARGDTSAVLRASTASWAARNITVAALIKPLGIAALGWAWLAASAVDAAVHTIALRKHGDIRLWRYLWLPTFLAIVASLVGRLVSALAFPQGVVALVAGAAIGEILFVAAVVTFMPQVAGDCYRLVRRQIGR